MFFFIFGIGENVIGIFNYFFKHIVTLQVKLLVTNNHNKHMLCTSYLFDIMHHNMQKLNKAAVKQVLFYVYDCFVPILLFRYKSANWNWYF